jgi:hypothetical protein
VLADYSTDSLSGTREVRAGTVRNIGSGVANHVRATVPSAATGFLPVGGGELIAILAPGQSAAVKFELLMEEPAVQDGVALGQVTAVLLCEDVHGWRHEFPFTFFVTESDVGLTESVAPGLKLAARRHWSISPLQAWCEDHLPWLFRPPKRRRYLNPAA